MIYSLLRLTLFLIVFIIFSLMQGISGVFACTLGPGPTIEAALSGATAIVRGRVIESDIARQNYIVQVESYLTGIAGPEFLLFSQNRPEYIQGIIDTKLGGGDCYDLKRPFPEQRSAYFLLGKPSLNGSYYLGTGSYAYIFWEDDFPVDMYAEDNKLTGTYSQNEFEQFILNLRGSKPAKPLAESRYPSTAPLLITTEDGAEFVLPVSSRKLEKIDKEFLKHYIPEWVGEKYEESGCRDWDCVTWSGDGRTLIVRLANEFAYVQGDGYHDFRFKADSFLISPISLAVWQDDKIIIYALHDSLRYASDGIDLPREIARISIELNNEANAQNSVWSSDGHLLAFSDVRGLWLWDVFTPNSYPILLRVTASDVPVALNFSGQERYLAFAQGKDRQTLDLLTHNILPFGYMSPDETLMVICEPQPTIERGQCLLHLKQLTPQSTLPAWGIQVDQALHVQWVNDRRVLLKVCEQPQNICGVIDSNAYDYGFTKEWLFDYNIYMGSSNFKPALDFAIQGRNVVTLIDHSTIDVNGVTLSFDLENSIVEVRWLPSLFYGENPYPPQI